ncbi:MAG: adenylate/guanylate cyclase domain-containing protein [Desulfovibrionaceae bacterium]
MKPPPSLDQPFPLRKHYAQRILPGMVLFLLVLVAASSMVATQVMETVYLDIAGKRAAAIAAGVARSVPLEWERFLAGRMEADDPGRALVFAALRDVTSDSRFARLKIYALDTRILFSFEADEIGTMETAPVLRDVIDDHDPGIAAHTDPDGTVFYELYVPLVDASGRLLAVVELYEPPAVLDAVRLRSTLFQVLVPGVLLALLVWALTRLVGRAQDDIDARTTALVALRARLETFLSRTAVHAAHGAAPGGDVPSRRVDGVALYTDVRGFTSYSDTHDPATVVTFLNEVFGVQIAAIERHGGDVDKFIGDAVLAWFEGEAAPERAVRAARDILADLPPGLPRGIGVGIYAGPVIHGAVGPTARRDFTIIGDTVNMAARLCAAARAGEVVLESGVASLAGDAARAFSLAEDIRVKGRERPLSVRRWRVEDGAA